VEGRAPSRACPERSRRAIGSTGRSVEASTVRVGTGTLAHPCGQVYRAACRKHQESQSLSFRPKGGTCFSGRASGRPLKYEITDHDGSASSVFHSPDVTSDLAPTIKISDHCHSGGSGQSSKAHPNSFVVKILTSKPLGLKILHAVFCKPRAQQAFQRYGGGGRGNQFLTSISL
jgi:hypothetical protein